MKMALPVEYYLIGAYTNFTGICGWAAPQSCIKGFKAEPGSSLVTTLYDGARFTKDPRKYKISLRFLTLITKLNTFPYIICKVARGKREVVAHQAVISEGSQCERSNSSILLHWASRSSTHSGIVQARATSSTIHARLSMAAPASRRLVRRSRPPPRRPRPPGPRPAQPPVRRVPSPRR